MPTAVTVPPDFASCRLSPVERVAVRELVEGSRAALGPELREVRLFGSRARGEGHEESDVDLAFVVTGRGRQRRREIHDLAWEGLLRHGITLAPLVVTRERLDDLRREERRFASELERDGIVLWSEEASA